MSQRIRTLSLAALIAAAVPAAAIAQRMGLEMEPNGLAPHPGLQRVGLEMEPNG